MAKLWGSGTTADGKAGKGRVVAGKTPAEVLAAMKVQPDFIASRPIRYIHRTLGDREVYFVANSAPQAVDALCTLPGQRQDAGGLVPRHRPDRTDCGV